MCFWCRGCFCAVCCSVAVRHHLYIFNACVDLRLRIAQLRKNVAIVCGQGNCCHKSAPFRCSVLAQYSRLQRQNQGGTGLDFQQGNINTAPLHSTYCKKNPVVFGTFGFCNAYFVLFFRLCKFWRCRTSAAGRKNSRHIMHHLSIMMTRKLQFVSRIAQKLCFSF